MMTDLLIVSRDISKDNYSSMFAYFTPKSIFVMRVGETLPSDSQKFDNIVIGCRILSDMDMRWYHSHLLSLLRDQTKQPIWTN